MSKLLEKAIDILKEHSVLDQHFVWRVIRSDNEIESIKSELIEKYGESEIFLQLIEV